MYVHVHVRVSPARHQVPVVAVMLHVHVDHPAAVLAERLHEAGAGGLSPVVEPHRPVPTPGDHEGVVDRLGGQAGHAAVRSGGDVL